MDHSRHIRKKRALALLQPACVGVLVESSIAHRETKLRTADRESSEADKAEVYGFEYEGKGLLKLHMDFLGGDPARGAGRGGREVECSPHANIPLCLSLQVVQSAGFMGGQDLLQHGKIEF